MQELMTRPEAAEFLRVSLRTFDSLVAEGRIPRYRVSANRIVFRRKDLEEYVDANLVENEASAAAVARAVLNK